MFFCMKIFIYDKIISSNGSDFKRNSSCFKGNYSGGKLLKEHLEAINHEQAILFLDVLIKDKVPIKNMHQLLLKALMIEIFKDYNKSKNEKGLRTIILY